ncbi:MAG: nuclear transport factor 2 family protein [Cypionkella sp.]|uniref:nuclear transport factor 2 family protein n=1 Tax=Cypionkella sp. TaxID=2811411 RepID=UPI002ABAD85A|nr:nuclear transport factor 2 family protein [Cypionkella sp.]MDZ4311711.1 nuclear transport factor 2 family protein [Cypionkella sp.]
MIALPPALVTYFAALSDTTRHSFDTCFAPNAIVQDEAKTHRGLAEIKAWHIAANAPVNETLPLSLREDAGRTIVTAKVSGGFKGSPLTLDFSFAMNAGLITELEIN